MGLISGGERPFRVFRTGEGGERRCRKLGGTEAEPSRIFRISL